MKRRWIAVVQWIDSTDDSSFDADEIQVFAETPEAARSAAARQWRLTIGAQWPALRLEKIVIYTPAQHRAVA